MPQTMEALVFRAPGEWGLEAFPVPKIQKDDDVLLKVNAASICGTDLHILSVPPGHPATQGSILGHEYTATVVDSGTAVQHLKPGDHVVIAHREPDGGLRYSVYGHLLEGSIAVEAGAPVERGEYLGRVGRTGRASTDHLHFEIRSATAPEVPWEHAEILDPLDYIAAHAPRRLSDR